MAEYAHPEVLVSTQWVAEQSSSGGPNSKIRLIEVDVDTSAYDQGHIAGAVGWNWQTQLQDNIRRDLIDKSALENLLGQSGVSNDTTIILYGDNNNWFAAYAFWQLKYYGHKDVRLMNGGRKKWIEEKRPLIKEAEESHPRRIMPQTRRISARPQGARLLFDRKERRGASSGCSVARRIHRQNHCTAWHERNRAARRAYSDGGEHPLVASRE